VTCVIGLMKVRIYSKNVISRAIYTPKLLFAYGTRFSRAYDTHFLAYNNYELPTPLPPKPTQGGFSARKNHIWRINATRNDNRGIDTHFHETVLDRPYHLINVRTGCCNIFQSLDGSVI